jgi:hypothetical protein
MLNILSARYSELYFTHSSFVCYVYLSCSIVMFNMDMSILITCLNQMHLTSGTWFGRILRMDIEKTRV